MEKSSKIKHVVVMMFENRSFDSLLGYLYNDNNNKSPLGHPFEGLTGKEGNPDSDGNAISVYPIDKDSPTAYFMPKKDPGEGFANTNFQLFGAGQPPYPTGIANNQGFVRDFQNSINNEKPEELEKKDDPLLIPEKKKEVSGGYDKYKSDDYKKWYKSSPPSRHVSEVPDLNPVVPKDIMGVYTSEMLPVLSGLAKGYAVCDHWYCSVPTETLPNRAFTHMGTSQGYLYDEVKSYSAKSIFKHLTDHNHTWGIFGNNGSPYTVAFCQDIKTTPHPTGCMTGSFEGFKTALTEKTLPTYTFLEPIWGTKGNSQHPNYNVAEGDAYLLEIYNALKSSEYWEDTLLVITYDEHGGCYDHVTPPTNATSPPEKSVAFDFDFTRFGVRVPTVLISPWIEAGTVYRTNSSTPLDHTSILSTLEKCFGMPPLTERDKAAPEFTDVQTLSKARTDDPIKGVVAPTADPSIRIQPHASQIQKAHAGALAEKASRETGKTVTPPEFSDGDEASRYIDDMHKQYYGAEE